MKIEYEATFPSVEKEDARKRLKSAGAQLIRPEFLQKRIVLGLPPGHEVKGGFVRVRDEGDKITLTFKIVGGEKITDQKETLVIVNDFDETVELLKAIGCVPQTYEESKRELWSLDDVEITIDDWPFLGSFIEVEGKSEDEVKQVSINLGFKWEDARFCTAGTLYVEKYSLGPVDLAKKTNTLVTLTFNGKNPFLGLK
jgi:adenylate cyclase class 2